MRPNVRGAAASMQHVMAYSSRVEEVDTGATEKAEAAAAAETTAEPEVTDVDEEEAADEDAA